MHVRLLEGLVRRCQRALAFGKSSLLDLGDVGKFYRMLFFYLLFPTLAVGLLDFTVDVVLARLEADFSDQPPSLPAVPTVEYPCSAQPPSIPAVPNHEVSLQCPTNEYPCNA